MSAIVRMWKSPSGLAVTTTHLLRDILNLPKQSQGIFAIATTLSIRSVKSELGAAGLIHQLLFLQHVATGAVRHLAMVDAFDQRYKNLGDRLIASLIEVPLAVCSECTRLRGQGIRKMTTRAASPKSSGAGSQASEAYR